ncbi:MAG: DNA/RNA nuclease SfsA [Myxococcales bacterium]|nr:DNA/RNA nuclease SfsA [Myxococcales bacterium]
MSGTLLRRYHRFLTDVRLASGEVVQAHCVNTGAMEGLIRPGASVWLCPASSPGRKLPFTWMCIELPDKTKVGVDTSLPNRLVSALLSTKQLPGFERHLGFTPEVAYGGGSRADFRVDMAYGACFLEVKNVHLVYPDGGAYFPDSVSARGAKHLRELAEVVRKGGKASVLFVIQREDARFVRPSDVHDPAFAREARVAAEVGVTFHALKLRLTEMGAEFAGVLPVDLSPYDIERPRRWRDEERRWSGWERPG